MKRWMLAAALFGALVVTAPSAWSQVNLLGLEQAPPEQVGVSKEKLGRIHDALQESNRRRQASRHGRAGRPQGQARLCRRRGFQDKDDGKPMAMDSIFRIYSMTKPLVSVARHDAGGGRQDPAHRSGLEILSGVQGPAGQRARSDAEFARMTYTTVPAEREITVQDLLRHTAGLAYGEITLNAPVKDAYTKAGLYMPGVATTTRAISRRPRRSSGSPRRRWRTSRARCGNTAWRSMCSAAWSRRRRASGWRIFSTSALFKPLKMQRHGFWVPGAKIGRARPAAAGRSRQRPAEQSHRCLERAEERFRRRRRGLDRGRLSALRADAAQRRPTRRHAGAVAHDRRADDLGSSGHADRGAGHAERAAARHPGYTFGLGFAVRQGAGDRRRSRLGRRVHVGRLCRDLFLGRSEGGTRRRLHEPGAEHRCAPIIASSSSSWSTQPL